MTYINASGAQPAKPLGGRSTRDASGIGPPAEEGTAPAAVRVVAPSGSVRWYAKGGYRVGEAGALFFGLSRAAAYKAVEDGRLPVVRISQRRYVVTADAVDRLLHPEDYCVAEVL